MILSFEIGRFRYLAKGFESKPAFCGKDCLAREKRNPIQEFDGFFESVYGARWDALKRALGREPNKITLHNPFALDRYDLDAASTVPVVWLGAKGEHHADFCASPGGKFLAHIFQREGRGRWFASDLSPARVARLKAVLHDCVPAEVMERIEIRVGDASRWGMKMPETFDSILVDAPCSGERHLLESPQEIGRWSKKGSQRLAVRQNALLCSALDALKPGGRMVYSTCSISPIENDGVVEKFEKSRKGKFRRIEVKESKGEATEKGWILLPDVTDSGPIYFSVFEKI